VSSQALVRLSRRVCRAPVRLAPAARLSGWRLPRAVPFVGVARRDAVPVVAPVPFRLWPRGVAVRPGTVLVFGARGRAAPRVPCSLPISGGVAHRPVLPSPMLLVLGVLRSDVACPGCAAAGCCLSRVRPGPMPLARPQHGCLVLGLFAGNRCGQPATRRVVVTGLRRPHCAAWVPSSVGKPGNPSLFGVIAAGLGVIAAGLAWTWPCSAPAWRSRRAWFACVAKHRVGLSRSACGRHRLGS